MIDGNHFPSCLITAFLEHGHFLDISPAYLFADEFDALLWEVPGRRT